LIGGFSNLRLLTYAEGVSVMPMFPLGSVLLPFEYLPLHVFESRYRQLVIDLLADDVNPPEFGVTLIDRGHEVGGGDIRAPVGTIARIIHIEALDQERYALVAVGERRCRVNAWLPDDPYPLADVDSLIDPVPDPEIGGRLSVEIAAVHGRVLAIHQVAADLGDQVPEGPTDLSDDPVAASYQLVSLAPLGPADRYRLLAAPSLPERLEMLEQALDDVEATLKFRSS
jgi:Lon protease-like protein